MTPGADDGTQGPEPGVDVERSRAMVRVSGVAATGFRALLATHPAGAFLLELAEGYASVQLARRLEYLEGLVQLLQVEHRDLRRQLEENERAHDLVERGARAAEDAPDADVRRLVEQVIAQGLREGASERAFLLTSILDGLLSAHVRVLQYGIGHNFAPYEVERDLPDLAGAHEAVLGDLVAKGLATVMSGTLGGGGGSYFLTRLGLALAQEAAESG